MIEYAKRLEARATVMSLALKAEADALRARLTAAETLPEQDATYRAIKEWNGRASALLRGYQDVRGKGRR